MSRRDYGRPKFFPWQIMQLMYLIYYLIRGTLSVLEINYHSLLQEKRTTITIIILIAGYDDGQWIVMIL